MMSKKTDQVFELEDYLQIEVSIECEVCSEWVTEEEKDAIVFYDAGWRVKFGYCMCPKCVKKFKKIRTQLQANILQAKLMDKAASY